MSGPAGELSAVFFARDDGYPRVLCGQGPAPAALTPGHFAELGLGVVPATGVLSAPVPGAFDAWMTLLRDYGTKTPCEVLDAAIGLAENGHPILFVTALRIAQSERTFRELWPESGAIYLPGGTPHKERSILRNPGMAATYRRILAESEAAGGSRENQIDAARRAWYQGFVAEEIDRFARVTHPDPNFSPMNAVITGEDLARYEAVYETPVTLA